MCGHGHFTAQGLRLKFCWISHLGCAGAVEGVSFQNVSSSLQELIVNVCNDVRAGDDQQIIVAPELMMVILIPITPEILFCQPTDNWHVHIRHMIQSCCRLVMHTVMLPVLTTTADCSSSAAFPCMLPVFLD